jgi:hypothetical protein
MYLFQCSRPWRYCFQRCYPAPLRALHGQTTPEKNSGAGGVRNIWGFVDGTMRAICRPGINQELFYSGYKKCQAVKYQAVCAPDGLMSHPAGPGHRGDCGMYQESGLQDHLRDINRANGDVEQQRLYLNGDPAYGLSYDILSAYKAKPRQPLNPSLKAFSAIMSGHRAAGQCMLLWSFNRFKNDLKVGLGITCCCVFYGCCFFHQYSHLFARYLVGRANISSVPLERIYTAKGQR